MRAGEPLAIEWAFAASSTNGFNLRFNRPVNPHAATNLANYQLNPPSVILSVSPQHGTNLQEYVVKLAGPLPHNPFVLVNGVADFSTPSQTLVSSQFGIQPTSGWLSAFYYGQVNGGTALFGDKYHTAIIRDGAGLDPKDAGWLREGDRITLHEAQQNIPRPAYGAPGTPSLPLPANTIRIP